MNFKHTENPGFSDVKRIYPFNIILIVPVLTKFGLKSGNGTGVKYFYVNMYVLYIYLSA